MIAAQSFSQRPLIISYFEEMHDQYQPESLAKPLPADTALKVGYYYAAYRFKGKPVHSVRHISSNQLVTELQYTYVRGKITNIVVERHSDSTYSKCLVANKEIMRHTQCFDRNDKLVSEEWYNTKTTEYNLATFDSTGVANFTEWGRYSPPDDHR